ncbi:MAG: metalloregulator ArsR/SmtB family transcription factor [Nitrospinaceae bacterium]|nr:metalloregulator ArsR/SmtB family transcription factor [Nitrospinaceae bacterium]
MKALGDETRLRMVRLLLQGELSVSDIVRQLDMAQPQVSHHLSILRTSGLVETRREGNRIINFIDPEKALPKMKNSGIDLGCCSISFDSDANPRA